MLRLSFGFEIDGILWPQIIVLISLPPASKKGRKTLLASDTISVHVTDFMFAEDIDPSD